MVLVVLVSSDYWASAVTNPALEQAKKSLLARQQTGTSKITADGAFNTYENPDYNITIKYPKSWKASEVNLPQYGIVLLNAPEATDSPTSLESYVYTPGGVLVASQILPVENMTLEQYVKFLFKDVYANATQYRVINSVDSNLAGMKSYKITMYEYWKDATFKVMRNVALDPSTKTVYMIKYSAHPGKFFEFLPVVQQMMDSLKVK